MTKKDGTNRYKCVISAGQTSWPLTVGQKSRKVIFARLFSVINHSVQLIAHPGSKKGEKNKNKKKNKTKNKKQSTSEWIQKKPKYIHTFASHAERVTVYRRERKPENQADVAYVLMNQDVILPNAFHRLINMSISLFL